MRVACPVWWLVGLVVAVLPAASASAQPRDDPKDVRARIQELKPAAADPQDTPLRKLLKERYNARLEAAQLQARAVGAGTVSLREFTDLLVRLAENGAEMEDGADAKVKWYELRVEVLRQQERMARERAKAGGVSAVEVSLATAARLDAEIELLRLKDGLQKDKK